MVALVIVRQIGLTFIKMRVCGLFRVAASEKNNNKDDRHNDHSFGSSIYGSRDLQNTSSSFGLASLYNKINHGHSLANGIVKPQRFSTSGNFSQHFNYSNP